MKNNRNFTEDLTLVLEAADEIPVKLSFPLGVTTEQKMESIDTFISSNRATNALHRQQIHTAGNLIDKFDEIGRIRNLGEKSVKEAKNGLLKWYYNSLDANGISEFWNDFRAMNGLSFSGR